MSEYRVRRRTRLKNKESRALREQIEARLGVSPWEDGAPVEVGEAPDGIQVVLAVNEALAIVEGGEPFLSVRGLLKHRPERCHVTVDMGAVPFVHNGADVMAPGIVDADPALQEGDWCWVRDERNRQPLAVGRCLVSGASMKAGSRGKAVRTVHFIGDRLWNWVP